MEHFWILVCINLLMLLAGNIKLGEATRRKIAKDDFVRVHVPAYVREGGTAFLKCVYDVDNDHLYSMKWYKGPKEFFRFTPKESPPVKIFPAFGGHVDLSLSNFSHVALTDVDLNMTDRYTCEVTKDFPDYTTSLRTGKMTVVAFPERNPQITSTQRSVSVGDAVTVDCTSFRSSPGANITWLLNGFPVSLKYLTLPSIIIDTDEKETITVGLNFTVRQQHFVRNRMTVTCQAKIEPDLYTASANVSILEHVSPMTSSVVKNYSSIPSKTRGNSRYRNSGSSLGTRSAISFIVAAQFAYLSLLWLHKSSL